MMAPTTRHSWSRESERNSSSSSIAQNPVGETFPPTGFLGALDTYAFNESATTAREAPDGDAV
jgi:hypothetical protein